MAADLLPSPMRLALLSPIHGQSIDHIARQLENYRVFLSPFELHHYFHISLESHPDLQDNIIALAEREGHSIVFTKRRKPTWRPCTAYALCELIKTALADYHVHDKVLIHTDTDLLLTTKAKDQLRNHRIGCGDKAFHIDSQSSWKWSSKAKSDPHLKRFVNEILDNDFSKLRVGRVCGTYMPWSTFKIFGTIFNTYFNNNYFIRSPKRHWPITEIAIPSILHFLEGKDARFQPPLIKVPEGKHVSRQSIKQLLKKSHHFGLKKLGRDGNNEALHFAMHLQDQVNQ